jgi:uncharacterized protein YcbX
MDGRVTRISIAPVKALGLVHPDSVELGHGGVVGDRRFWMRTDEGRLVNAKLIPQVLLITPAWDESTRRLSLRFPDGAEVAGIVELGDPVSPALYGKQHPSRRVIGPWEAALARYAGFPLELLWSEQGAVDRGALGGGWMSVISRASLERLATEAGVPSVDGRRFRMLFEIDGVAANEEDRWLGRHVQVGQAVVRPVGDVGRCAVTKCDPDTGRSDLDTLGVLAGYRREGQTEPLPLGVYGEVVVPGRVAVGDAVGMVEDAVAAEASAG